MTYKQRQYTLKTAIEKWLKSVEVGKTFSPTEFSSYLAEFIMKEVADSIQNAYTQGRLVEHHYRIEIAQRSKSDIPAPTTAAIIYAKDNGWTL